jgi:hypothetical protein
VDREQSIELWLKGKEEWNAWANKMLAQRAELENAGEEKRFKLQEWREEACVDFSSRRFAPPVDASLTRFADFIFPWTVLFVDTQFQGEASFSGARFRGPAAFLGTQFHGETSFIGAQFHGPGGFLEAQFHSRVCFSDARFQKWDQFLQTQIKWQEYTKIRSVTFDGVAFQSAAYFNGVYFKETASFRGTKFLGLVEFHGAQFHGDAFFTNAKFEDVASFQHATFGAEKKRPDVDFSGIKASQSFNLLGVKFLVEVPAFNQADIKQPPDFSRDFPLPSFWGGREDQISKYRHIRRLTKDHDHETEQRAFHGELRSRRGNIDYRFGLSFWYDLVADCGRSIWTPFIVWLATLFAFAEVYLSNAGIDIANWQLMCWANESTVGLKALSLSIANAVPVIGSSRPEEIRSIYACLYGFSGVPQGSQQFNIPPWSPVIQVGQNVVSAILIFLFLLAIRNRFKIK